MKERFKGFYSFKAIIAGGGPLYLRLILEGRLLSSLQIYRLLVEGMALLHLLYDVDAL